MRSVRLYKQLRVNDLQDYGNALEGLGKGRSVGVSYASRARWNSTGEEPAPRIISSSASSAYERAEHYEMAAYGTLVARAQAMGHTEAAKLLQQTLDEEKAADKKLSGLAEGGINQSAAHAAHSDEDEEREAAVAGGARKGSSKSGRR